MDANVIENNNDSNIDPYDRMYGDVDTLSGKRLCSFDSDCRQDEYCYKLKCLELSIKPYIEQRDNRRHRIAHGDRDDKKVTTTTPIVCEEKFRDVYAGYGQTIACIHSLCGITCLELKNPCFNHGECHNKSIFWPQYVCRCSKN